MTDYIVIFITIDNKEKAEEISNMVVNKKLAACCNIVDNIKSIYQWKGRIEKEEELLLIIKTNRTKFDELLKNVKEIHPYEVPEIIALPIIEGNEDYLKWIDESII